MMKLLTFFGIVWAVLAALILMRSLACLLFADGRLKDKGLRFGKGIFMMTTLPLTLFSSSGRRKLFDVFLG